MMRSAASRGWGNRIRSQIVDGWGLLAVPALIFVGVFLLVPLGDVALRAFTEPSAVNFTAIFESSTYRNVFATTFRTAAIVTACCLILAYPYAYALVHSGRWVRLLLLIALLLPFWSSLLVRSFSWISLLQDTGTINRVLLDLGLIDEPLKLIRTSLGVTVGMTHILLPYMVLPLYAVMMRVSPSLMEAAGSLGASRFRAFRKVYLPLTLPGLAAGCLVVFVLSLGFYITPALLGGPKSTMIGELIASQVNEQGAFGPASAVAIILLVVTLAVIGLGAWLLRGSNVSIRGNH